MMPHIAPPRTGFSLLEVMIAAVVLSFGLLGLVALQTTSKFSGYEARQRTIASWLATDIVERARINRSVWELQSTQAWMVSAGSAINKPNCGNVDGTMVIGCRCIRILIFNAKPFRLYYSW
jgi:type IV pilus assembly protein PilV